MKTEMTTARSAVDKCIIIYNFIIYLIHITFWPFAYNHFKSPSL